MTELLERAVEAVRQMPAERQDAIARWMLDLAEVGAPEPLDPEDIAAIEEGLAQIERGGVRERGGGCGNLPSPPRTVKVRLTRRAAQDFNRITAHVRAHHRAAAIRFADEIEACFDLIARHPEAGRSMHRGTRRLVVRRESYAIIYPLVCQSLPR